MASQRQFLHRRKRVLDRAQLALLLLKLISLLLRLAMNGLSACGRLPTTMWRRRGLRVRKEAQRAS